MPQRSKMQAADSASVLIPVSNSSQPDPRDPVPSPRNHRDKGMEAYNCLCFSFILVLGTILIIFVVGIIRASMSTDGYELGNMVFMALCIALLVMLIMTSLACLCMCHKHTADLEGDPGQHRNGSSKGGAFYIVGWNMKILKQSGNDCPICWERMDSNNELKAKLVCQHVFHFRCWEKYSRTAQVPSVCCPLCRAIPIKFPGVERIKSDFKIFIDRFRCFTPRRNPPDSTGVAMIDV
ncbi:uncharacterized protein LOC134235819 [Saccostrea cucullata]|uniref:uncharacterized protein LOC134235819 n=1 Tax=Saccostrea cuccullata TaxID=36930 RepID=UPI002ECFC124